MNQETVNIISSIAIPIITFIMGFFVSRFTMTKKESADHKNRLQENSNKLSSHVSDAFERFTQALATYNSNSPPPTADDFFAISTTGEIYFDTLRRL